jgi:hypothetical protein
MRQKLTIKNKYEKNKRMAAKSSKSKDNKIILP